MTLDQDTKDCLRALQRTIGNANAEKGFHERGDALQRDLRDAFDAYEIELLGEDAPEPDDRINLAQDALRDYYVARLALITTEVAEAVEELRDGNHVRRTYYPTNPVVGFMKSDGTPMEESDLPRKVGESITFTAVREDPDGIHKPEGVPSELADVVIRAFDFADETGIDLAAIIDEKLRYNATRPRMHGRTM